jgi:two-component system chemotaxis sensor kinase CheA
MVRNALDHGLEPPDERVAAGKPRQGRVRLAASHHSGHILVEVSDDGRGLDPDRIFRKAVERGLVTASATLTAQEILELIFEPGFSTSQVVTELSGRGVGMDVVKKSIERLRGRVEIRSELGHGTCFQLRVPLTLAIIDALVVRSGLERYIVPLFAVREIIGGGTQELRRVEGRHEVTLVRERVIPVLRLDSLLGRPRPQSTTAGRGQVLVIAEAEGKRFGLSVDEVIGKQQVVIKSLGDWLGRLRGIAGGAILGDGSVGIILDLQGLVAKEAHALSA